MIMAKAKSSGKSQPAKAAPAARAQKTTQATGKKK